MIKVLANMLPQKYPLILTGRVKNLSLIEKKTFFRNQINKLKLPILL
jgi:hypothetical protein